MVNHFLFKNSLFIYFIYLFKSSSFPSFWTSQQYTFDILFT
jgi:hypothetical protein